VEYIGCGNYYKRLNGLSCAFIVTKLDDITEKVIPLYTKYSLLGSKNQDYLDFKRVAELMNEKAHLTAEGLNQIQAIKSGMNRGVDKIILI
jgi:hypothetical protein